MLLEVLVRAAATVARAANGLKIETTAVSDSTGARARNGVSHWHTFKVGSPAPAWVSTQSSTWLVHSRAPHENVPTAHTAASALGAFMLSSVHSPYSPSMTTSLQPHTRPLDGPSPQLKFVAALPLCSWLAPVEWVETTHRAGAWLGCAATAVRVAQVAALIFLSGAPGARRAGAGSTLSAAVCG